MTQIKMTVALADALDGGRKCESWYDCGRVKRADVPTGLQRFAFADVYDLQGVVNPAPALTDFKRRDLPRVFVIYDPKDGREWVVDQAGCSPGDAVNQQGGYGYARYLALIV